MGPPRSTFAAVAGLWLVLAIGVGSSGILLRLPPLAVPAGILGMVVALVATYGLSIGFRQWCRALDVRWLVLLNVSRFVGIYCLVLQSRCELPWEFALVGGWGDIMIASLALGLLLLLVGWSDVAPPVLVIWNLFGLADILFGVTTAARLVLQQPGSMRALAVLPLSLLPTFLVPLLIGSHLLILTRICGRRRPAQRPSGSGGVTSLRVRPAVLGGLILLAAAFLPSRGLAQRRPGSEPAFFTDGSWAVIVLGSYAAPSVTRAGQDSISLVTVRAVLDSAGLVGRRVRVVGRCLGYSVPTIARGAPPVTRSDWQLEDAGEAVWVSGPLPNDCTATVPASAPRAIVGRVARDTLAGLGGRPPMVRQYLMVSHSR